MNLGPEVEEYLGEKFLWRKVAQGGARVYLRSGKSAQQPRSGQQSCMQGPPRRYIDLPAGETVSDDLKAKTDTRIQDWQKNRKDTQIHSPKSRYFYAKDTHDTIHAICVLHQLSSENSQILAGILGRNIWHD
jgi:hypothetical protein